MIGILHLEHSSLKRRREFDAPHVDHESGISGKTLGSTVRAASGLLQLRRESGAAPAAVAVLTALRTLVALLGNGAALRAFGGDRAGEGQQQHGGSEHG